MNIQNFISRFLLRHDTLDLPGLGTIKKIRTEAGFEKGEIRPPGSRLIFSSEESADKDNLPIKDIAEGEDISLEEANQRVLEFIDDIKFAFNKGEAFTIEAVCTLSLDENNNVRLDQDPDFIGDAESYGLESLEFEDDKKESGEEKIETEDKTEEEKEFYNEKMSWVLDEEQDMHKFEETYVTGSYDKKKEAEKSRDEVSDKEELHEEKLKVPQSPPPPPSSPPYSPTRVMEMRKRSVRRKLNIGLAIAGVAILIVAAFIFIPIRLDFFENEINFDDIFGSSEEMEVNDDFSDIQDEDFNFDEMVDDLEKDLDSSAKMDNALDIPEESAEEEQIAPAGEEEYVEYHIIAGSFRDYENAKELQQELTLQGYPSLIIEPGTGIYRVSAISFRDKVTALNKLVEFREKTGMSTAWLMNLE